MKMHELKTVQPYFDMVWQGTKPYEIRKNDRGFEIGDILYLREYDPNTIEIRSSPYSDKSILAEVIDIIPAGNLEYVNKEYCVMTIEVIDRRIGKRHV